MTHEMTKKPRRRRSDSKEEAVRDMLNAGRVLSPPADYSLSAAERVIFNEIIQARVCSCCSHPRATR